MFAYNFLGLLFLQLLIYCAFGDYREAFRRVPKRTLLFTALLSTIDFLTYVKRTPMSPESIFRFFEKIRWIILNEVSL